MSEPTNTGYLHVYRLLTCIFEHGVYVIWKSRPTPRQSNDVQGKVFEYLSTTSDD